MTEDENLCVCMNTSFPSLGGRVYSTPTRAATWAEEPEGLLAFKSPRGHLGKGSNPLSLKSGEYHQPSAPTAVMEKKGGKSLVPGVRPGAWRVVS